MALRAIVQSLDEVPEAFHGEYREENGTFVLDLAEDVRAHPKITALSAAFERTKSAKNKLQTDLDAANLRLDGLPEDFDPAEYQRLKDAAADGKGPKVDERLQRQREELERKHAGDLARRDERIGVVEGALRRRTVDEGLTAALVEAGIDRKHLPVVKAFLAPQVKVTEQDGEFTASVETDINPIMPVAEFVKAWAGTDAGKIYVAPATGGGATGSGNKLSGDNPWDDQGGKVKPNLTRQQELVAQNPERARQLAKAAGVTPNW